MSIKTLKAPKKRNKRIIAYDLEWIPGLMIPRLVGVFDESRGYRVYTGATCVEDFLDCELNAKNAGAWFYAHAGGLADVQFLLEVLVKNPSYNVTAVFSGSSAIIVKVKKGKRVWTLLDSYWTIQSSLKEIGEWIGMPKGEVDWHAPLPELIEYNEPDCRILHRALTLFEDVVLSLGSELKPTLASCALRLFQRQYLKAPIETSSYVNHQIRPAYAGGRVEVFDRRGLGGCYYDINSHYPTAMTYPMPGNKIRSSQKLEAKLNEAVIADCTVTVPNGMRLPPLPFTGAGSLYFPTGTWRQWFCLPELRLAEEVGCRIEAVHQTHVYDTQEDMEHFAMDLYERRKQVKGSYMAIVYKLLMNSLYGKFGEQRLKTGLVIHPDKKRLKQIRQKAERFDEQEIKEPVKAYPFKEFAHIKEDDERPVERIQAGVFLVREPTEVAHAHVPIAAYVTSIARVMLYAHLKNADPHYCDTDGFGTSQASLPTSDELGAIKLEKEYEAGSLFHAPKLYHLITAAGVNGHIVKAKGFSRSLYYEHEKADIEATDAIDQTLGRHAVNQDRSGQPRPDPPMFPEGRKEVRPHGLDVQGFEYLRSGKAVYVRRMLRLRELYAKGTARPAETDQLKQLRGARPKRFFGEDGTSRPWTVEELHLPWSGKGRS